jgi:hypothetical protein
MKISHRVSFPGGREFEQHTAEFTLEDSDMKADVLKDCNLLEKMFLYNTITIYEGVLFQYTKGYFNEEEYKGQKARILSMLNPKLLAIFKDILRTENGNSG